MVVGGCLLALLLALLSRQKRGPFTAEDTAKTNSVRITSDAFATHKPGFGGSRLPPAQVTTTPTAEEIVAGKVLQFGRSRRELVREISRRTGKKIPAEVEQFFDAVESGDWNEIDRLWRKLAEHSGQYEFSREHWEDINPFWPSVLDAYGVAEQAHLWPAQKLLDYGNAVLGSLRPGMVYVGGTDPGRWIPELLNETSGGEPRIIVTQNAFADGRYIDFMRDLYGDRFNALTKADSERVFDEYKADALRRLQHDEQFPDEPKQVLANENIKVVDGKIQLGGQVAVMAINERLLQTMMEKNSDLSFAIEQSFPFKSTYAGATPIGPIMELGVKEDQRTLTSERATQSVDFWRTTAQQLLADSEADALDVRMSWSKLASNQGALLLDRSFTAEAEQIFRMAVDIAPQSREAVMSYANLLADQHRVEDAIPIVERAIQLQAAIPPGPAEENAHREREAKQLRDLLARLNGKKSENN
jgi:tetratricopeptide (TPR) repeat protein